MDSRYDIRSAMRNINDTDMKGVSATLNFYPSDSLALKYLVAKRESDTNTAIDFDLTTATLVDVCALPRQPGQPRAARGQPTAVAATAA